MTPRDIVRVRDPYHCCRAPLEELVVDGEKWRCYRFKSARFGNNDVRFDEDNTESGDEDSGSNHLKRSLSLDEVTIVQIPLGFNII